jgi:plastocyanin
MQKVIYVLCFVIMCYSLSFGTSHTVTNVGTTFSPSTLTITLGDTVQFVIDPTMHNAVQVSQATWNVNGTTSNGGFVLPLGGGTVVLTDTGPHYYVCTFHSFLGMKGMIIVHALTPTTSSLTINSIVDRDGNLSSTGDRLPKNWGLKLYKDSDVSGILIDSVSSAMSLTVNNLVPGTYVATEGDSAGWSHISVNVDGSSQGTTATNRWTIVMSAGEAHVIDFLNFATRTIMNSGFTFTPDSLVVFAGDTVHFVLETMHRPVEVDSVTWAANGNTPNGGFNLPFGGGNVVLTQQGIHYYVCDPHASLGMKGKIVVFSSSSSLKISNNISVGWNMTSVPVNASDQRKIILYPTAISGAFDYHGSYSSESILLNGSGYWLKFDSAQSVSLNGIALLHDTVDVLKGWNMIGSISFPVLFSTLTTQPLGIINSTIFGYNGSYFTADTIVPGFGYWVKVSQDGKLILNPSALAGSVTLNTAKEERATQENRLVVCDAAGNKKALFFFDDNNAGSDTRSLGELPPTPPQGAFDVRFSSGHQAKVIGSWKQSEEFPIQISSAIYPIILKWDIQASRENVFLKLNNEEMIALHSSGTVRIHVPLRSLSLNVVKSDALPKDYSLDQAYPDPFNPSTVIRYHLPIDSRVRMRVYNVLGEVVAALVDGVQQAGEQAVTWNADGNASGVYFVRFDAIGVQEAGSSFGKVIKVILEK